MKRSKIHDAAQASRWADQPDLEFDLSFPTLAPQAEAMAADRGQAAEPACSVSLAKSLIPISEDGIVAGGHAAALIDTLASMACEQASSLALQRKEAKNG